MYARCRVLFDALNDCSGQRLPDFDVYIDNSGNCSVVWVIDRGNVNGGLRKQKKHHANHEASKIIFRIGSDKNGGYISSVIESSGMIATNNEQ